MERLETHWHWKVNRTTVL